MKDCAWVNAKRIGYTLRYEKTASNAVRLPPISSADNIYIIVFGFLSALPRIKKESAATISGMVANKLSMRFTANSDDNIRAKRKSNTGTSNGVRCIVTFSLTTIFIPQRSKESKTRPINTACLGRRNASVSAVDMINGRTMKKIPHTKTRALSIKLTRAVLFIFQGLFYCSNAKSIMSRRKETVGNSFRFMIQDLGFKNDLGLG